MDNHLTPETTSSEQQADSQQTNVFNYIQEMIKRGASDLFLTVGLPPSFRVEDRIERMETTEPLTHPHMEELVQQIITPEQEDEFHATLELNVAIALDTGERFRINVFRQQHHTGMVIRLIRSQVPSFEKLRLPDIYKKLAMEKRGLVLMVGATGSGKSTSLAAMINHRNDNGSGHIITIEDPIEFVYRQKGCIITQREVGIDTYSYGIALKNALRQSPDVLVIGEIRDRDTLENAILFCETGHLVLATLHANNTNQAVERILNFFPEELHRQVLMTLSQNMRAILSQRLVDSTRGSRVLAYEILLNEGLITKYIEDGKLKELKEIIEKNSDRGMRSFDQSLFDLLQERLITDETALRESDSPNNLRLRIAQEGATNLHRMDGGGGNIFKPKETSEF